MQTVPCSNLRSTAAFGAGCVLGAVVGAERSATVPISCRTRGGLAEWVGRSRKPRDSAVRWDTVAAALPGTVVAITAAALRRLTAAGTTWAAWTNLMPAHSC